MGQLLSGNGAELSSAGSNCFESFSGSFLLKDLFCQIATSSAAGRTLVTLKSACIKATPPGFLVILVVK